MTRKLFLLFFTVFLTLIFSFDSKSQTSRKAVSGAEVTGTFRSYFKGKFKGSSNEIQIIALGKGKLKIRFDLIYPFVDGNGDLNANMGQAEGEAEIVGDRATYTNAEYGDCKITIKFVKSGTITVTQESDSSDCGFGFNVSADGTYKKVSSAKPKF